jgi:inner membrane protein
MELVVQLSDLTAVGAVDTMAWQGEALHPTSGALPMQPGLVGIRGVIPRFEGDSADVEIKLQLRGMEQLLLGAVGERTDIRMAGAWGAPSFTGVTLPQERTVHDDRFSGSWSIPGVARPVPGMVMLGEARAVAPLQHHTVGVRLVEPASAYGSVERALTYGTLVIGLCLLSFLFLEHGLNLKLHPVQWLVNGLALVVFYLVLLATSEHQGFGPAYGIASMVTLLLMTAYTVLATRSAWAGGAVFASLGGLYASMYAMLRSEDHALLMGTGLVVMALAATMWVTREVGRQSVEPEVADEVERREATPAEV